MLSNAGLYLRAKFLRGYRCAFSQVFLRHDLIDQSQPFRFFSRIHCASVRDYFSVPRACAILEHFSAARKQRRAELDLIEAYSGLTRHHDPVVACSGKHAPASYRVAVQSSNHRLRIHKHICIKIGEFSHEPDEIIFGILEKLRDIEAERKEISFTG